MTDYDYDVLVIGAGPGGYVAAIRAAQLGLKTACAEPRDTLGGTCLNVGCIPSKALLHASALYAETTSGAYEKAGLQLGAVTVDLDRVQAEKAAVVKELTGGLVGLFRKNKVTWLKGAAKFVTPDSVRVGPETVRARNIIIATGSSVGTCPGVRVDGEKILDSTSALALTKTPAHLVVIGGGVIGLELGSVWRRWGARVTIIEASAQILPGMDNEVRKVAAELLSQQGLVFKTSTRLVRAARSEAGVEVVVEAQDGKVETLNADAVLVATGRRPHTEGLDLERIGLKQDERGRIPVDSAFRTNIPHIFAIGDVTPGPMLAHRAEDEGIAVAEMIAGRPGMVNHDVIPQVVYTSPEIASVGLTEEEAKARGQVTIGKFPFAANSRARVNRDLAGFVKVVADAKTDRVLGVHIISTMAGTLIAQAAQAMEFGATSEDIAYSCHAHPTHAEALKEAAMGVLSQPIHI